MRHLSTITSKCFVAGLFLSLTSSEIVSGSVLVNIPLAVVTVTLHEPVGVDVVLENTGAFAEAIDLGQRYDKAFQVRIVSPSGQLAGPQPRYPVLDGAYDTISIASGSSRTVRLLLNDWVPFDSPGEYRLDISLPGATPTAFVRVIVLPRDRERLRVICRDLAEKARVPEYLVAENAARALSFVTDDEAIPFLSEMARSTLFDTFAIEGLARIGNLASVGAMETFMRETKDPSKVSFPRSRLRSLRVSAADEVRKEIDLILERLPEPPASK